MLSAIVATRDERADDVIRELAAESELVHVSKTLAGVSGPYELVRILNNSEADILFVDLSDSEIALSIASLTSSWSGATAIIGFGAGWDPVQESRFAQAGVFECLESPVALPQFRDCIDRAIHRVRGVVQPNLVAFLPAKAGSGATTVALNAAGALTENLGKKVLLIESDLHSGVLSILLNCQPPLSVLDALTGSQSLDSTRWSQLVVNAHGVDLLLTHRSRKQKLPFWSNYLQLLEFAAPRYDTIIVDLPEVVNEATVEIVRRAQSVFIVCTPEMPSLTLARQRCEELKNRNIAKEKTGILVNRWHRNAPPLPDLEEFLQHSVAALFENDYPSVHKASVEKRFVNRGTKLGACFLAFANRLTGNAVESPAASGFKSSLMRLIGTTKKSSTAADPASKVS